MDKHLDRLENWKENIDNFIITKSILMNKEGDEKIYYLIRNIKTTVSYKIEDEEVNNRLVEEMISQGVKVLSEDESLKVFHPQYYYSSLYNKKTNNMNSG